MTARKTIAKLGADPTKAQEWQFLTEVSDSVPADSYLASLLTADLLHWFNAQMRQDVCPDLWGTLVHAQDRAMEEKAAWYREREELSAQIVQKQAQMKQGRAEWDRQVKQLGAQHEALGELTLAWQEKADTASQQLEEQRMLAGDLKAHIETQKQQILELKARLYDLGVGAAECIDSR